MIFLRLSIIIMMVYIGGEILIILAVLFTVITQVTPNTCAHYSESCELLHIYISL